MTSLQILKTGFRHPPPTIHKHGITALSKINIVFSIDRADGFITPVSDGFDTLRLILKPIYRGGDNQVGYLKSARIRETFPVQNFEFIHPHTNNFLFLHDNNKQEDD